MLSGICRARAGSTKGRPTRRTSLPQKDGGTIKLSGTFKGKSQNKTFKIGDGLWYQMMDMSMPAFIASEEKQIVFYSIGTGNNRGAMGLGEFSAGKVGEETIEVNGKPYDCVKISLFSRHSPGLGRASTGMRKRAGSWYRLAKKERMPKKTAISCLMSISPLD